MKNIVVVLLVIGILFSGCIGGEDEGTPDETSEESSEGLIEEIPGETPPGTSEGSFEGTPEGTSETLVDSQTTDSESDQTPDLIIKPGDVPGLTLYDYNFQAFPESKSFGVYNTTEAYTDSLPSGTRKVAESSLWGDEAGHDIRVSKVKFDPGLGPNESYFAQVEAEYEQIAKVEKEQGMPVTEYYTCNIGKNCFYTITASPPDIELVLFTFSASDDEVVIIHVVEEKGKGLDEAIRIAELVESRLH
jgi:hypothetical protein